MNALAVIIHRLTERGDQCLAEEQPVLAHDERVALDAVLPLIQQSTRALAQILEEGEPPDVWLTPTPRTIPNA
jgi:hypothetical protein